MGGWRNISLLGGWFPVTVQVVAAGALLLAVGWRDHRWRWRVLPVVVVAAVLLALLAAYPGARAMRQVDPLPFAVWFWLGAAAGALLVLVAGWRSARWWRRGTALLAAALAAFVCANGINQFVGYYPTLGAAIDDWTHAPLPGQTTLPSAVRAAGAARVPEAGKLVAVTVPATYSHFVHRQELVYLPPIWFVGHRRPVLPVVEMIGGQRGGPGDWVRLANAVQVADSYARLHGGYAPILVFADATGHFSNDTECVNGPKGNAADHLARDLPAYVQKTFGASRNPRQWAVAGFSMGGTCSIDLVVKYPNVFNHFVDISGDLVPYTGTRAQTLQDLYGGSVAARRANEALSVMQAHGHYSNVSGVFLTSADEPRHQREARQLSEAAAKVGIRSRVEINPGTHTWQFAAPAFASTFPWLVTELTTPTSPRA
ncbi:alpha/beta hydrolase [Kribbella sp. NPDC004875]|uniref:alpha/beta hydrolase n=1 Tax=Kribbella sp. NPDC004875 TaxID=3364107 RepID=UPI0036AB21CF